MSDAERSTPAVRAGGDVIERAARALHAWDVEDGPCAGPWADLTDNQREVWRSGASALAAAGLLFDSQREVAWLRKVERRTDERDRARDLAAALEAEVTRRSGLLLSAISQWVDDSYADDLAPETALWRRVGKVSEESGEVTQALIGYVGENPRKGFTHTADDLTGELLDVAIAALGAVEHIKGNNGSALPMLFDKIVAVYDRALNTGEATSRG